MPDGTLRNSPPVRVLAGTTGEEWTADQQLQTRLQRLSRAKRRSVDAVDYIHSRPLQHGALQSVARALGSCGNDLVFRHFLNAGESRLRLAHTCKVHLLCGFCAVTRGSKALKNYLERFESVTSSDASLRPWLVTFTVKDGADLAERFRHLHDCLRIHRRRVSRGNASSEWSKALGSVWSFEFKRGANSGLWHPHVHCVWLCREAPDQRALQDEWRAVTGDSFMVDARPIVGDPAEGFSEVFKYAVKLGDMAMADRIFAYCVLRGRRLIASAGLFRGVVVESEAPDEMLPDPFYYDLLFRFQNARGYEFDRFIVGD